MRNPFKIILAIDSNNGIGKNGTLPWKIKEDLQLFSKITRNNIIIMGRKTWDSLPVKPLPSRINIIISRSTKPSNINDNVLWFNDLTNNSLNSFLENEIKKNKTVFCIGGAGILNTMETYKQYCTELLLHKVNHNYNCDTSFNIQNWIKNKHKTITFTKLVLDKSNNKQVEYSQVVYSNLNSYIN